jgi:hypothetical protein
MERNDDNPVSLIDPAFPNSQVLALGRTDLAPSGILF